jgi:hypothetical protein
VKDNIEDSLLMEAANRAKEECLDQIFRANYDYNNIGALKVLVF